MGCIHSCEKQSLDHYTAELYMAKVKDSLSQLRSDRILFRTDPREISRMLQIVFDRTNRPFTYITFQSYKACHNVTRSSNNYSTQSNGNPGHDKIKRSREYLCLTISRKPNWKYSILKYILVVLL